MPKRKSEALNDPEEVDSVDHASTNASTSRSKKARVAEASSSTSKQKDAPKSWKDVELEDEDDGSVPIFDLPGEVRRKIRLLLKTPNFKIGNINSNSYNRFMSMRGPLDGAQNGTYYAAYVYFEKVRIAEGKRKTPKRIENEKAYAARGGL
ncbi:hypothetical protein PM082_002939 [Marasmius tenuissimus]|nr:hypothetical protein PM082_002939 [Marasmius tenuissimus]